MPRPLNVVFFVSKPVFNLYEVEKFASFDKNHSSFLRQNLLINQLEVMESLQIEYRVNLILHQFDIGATGMDELQRFKHLEVVFYEVGDEIEILREILEEDHAGQEVLVVVNPFVIGLINSDYEYLGKIADLEDEISYLIKSSNGFLSVFASNYFERKMINLILNINEPFNKLLKEITSLNSRPIQTTSGLVVKGVSDFKELYSYLSIKESIPSCSYEMHDRFTELFVEYKEYL
jgi:hypothetical protein